MKYWLFDGKDAQGPFEPEELKRLPGFTAETLICPDGAGSADQWRPSQYYLVKPPPAKAEQARTARGPAAVSKGMGRIAEAGLADAEPAPAPAAQPQRQPLPDKRRFSSAALLTAAIAATAAAAGYLYLNQQKLRSKPAPVPQAAAPAPVAAPAPPASPALTEGQIQDATAFVQGFKTQSPGRRLPAAPEDVFSPARWKAARTVGEALAMRGLLPLDSAAAAVLEKRGEGLRAGERELRKNRKRWAAYAERFMRNAAPLSWDVQRSKSCPTQSAATGEPTCFEVAALLRSQRGGAQDRHAFVADLTARTVKPLDSNAWLDLDPKGLAAWAAKNVNLGEPIDEEAVAEQSPTYGIPLEHHKHLSRHAPIIPQQEEKAADEADQDLGPPTPKSANDSQAAAEAPAQDKTDQGLDYTEPGAGAAKPQKEHAAPASGSDEQVLEKALLDPSAQPQPAPAAQSAPTPAQPAVPPGLEHAPSVPAQAQPAPPSGAPPSGAQPSASGAAGKKSAMDMSVDELKKYLNRDGGSN